MIKCKYQTKGGIPMKQMTLTDMEYSNRKRKPNEKNFSMLCMRTFMHIDFNEQQVPDATTLLKFRYILKKTRLARRFFQM